MIDMNLHELLRVEGTDRHEILCYLLFPPGTADTAVKACRRAFAAADYEVTELLSDGWPNEVVLVELAFEDPELTAGLTLGTVQRALAVNGCRAALCMLDGVFYGYEAIFSQEFADQTYAFCLEADSGVFCGSGSVRATEGWQAIIDQVRQLVHPPPAPGGYVPDIQPVPATSDLDQG